MRNVLTVSFSFNRLLVEERERGTQNRKKSEPLMKLKSERADEAENVFKIPSAGGFHCSLQRTDSDNQIISLHL